MNHPKKMELMNIKRLYRIHTKTALWAKSNIKNIKDMCEEQEKKTDEKSMQQ